MIRAFIKTAKGAFFDQEGNPLSAQQVQEFVNTAYQGIGVSFSGEGLKSEANGWYVGVDDNDPAKFHWFFSFKDTPFGRKFFALGHDGSREAKKEMLQFKQDIWQNKSVHPWIEASGRIAQLMESWGIPKVPFETAQIILPGKQLQQVDEYSYKRALSGGGEYTKTVYGYPKVPHVAHVRKSALLQPAEGKGYSRPS